MPAAETAFAFVPAVINEPGRKGVMRGLSQLRTGKKIITHYLQVWGTCAVIHFPRIHHARRSLGLCVVLLLSMIGRILLYRA
jgi:hypothetical protein